MYASQKHTHILKCRALDSYNTNIDVKLDGREIIVAESTLLQTRWPQATQKRFESTFVQKYMCRNGWMNRARPTSACVCVQEKCVKNEFLVNQPSRKTSLEKKPKPNLQTSVVCTQPDCLSSRSFWWTNGLAERFVSGCEQRSNGQHTRMDERRLMWLAKVNSPFVKRNFWSTLWLKEKK